MYVTYSMYVSQGEKCLEEGEIIIIISVGWLLLVGYQKQPQPKKYFWQPSINGMDAVQQIQLLFVSLLRRSDWHLHHYATQT